MKQASMTNKSLTSKQIGKLGEEIAAKHLQKLGFEIVEMNYSRKWGEIDIVAHRHESIHFVEVKSVSYETKADLIKSVTHETWRPEENVHQFKLHQISKAVETWLTENTYEGEWYIDIIAVRMVPRETFATVKFIENIVAE